MSSKIQRELQFSLPQGYVYSSLRIVTTLLHEVKHHKSHSAIEAMCIGGRDIATIVERY